MDDYLTNEDYELAEKNGISRDLVYRRFYENSWDKERAITQPKRGTVPTLWDEWKQVAEAHGICRSTFTSRLNYMEPGEAATKELAKTQSGGSKHFSDEILKLAAANGITPRRLYSRVFELEWSVQEAATTPIVQNSEAHKYRKDRRAAR